MCLIATWVDRAHNLEFLPELAYENLSLGFPFSVDICLWGWWKLSAITFVAFEVEKGVIDIFNSKKKCLFACAGNCRALGLNIFISIDYHSV